MLRLQNDSTHCETHEEAHYVSDTFAILVAPYKQAFSCTHSFAKSKPVTQANGVTDPSRRYMAPKHLSNDHDALKLAHHNVSVAFAKSCAFSHSDRKAFSSTIERKSFTKPYVVTADVVAEW